MKRILWTALFLVLLVPSVQAELGYQKSAAVTTAQTYNINAPTLLVINDGASSIYIRVFWEGETVSDATVNSTEIKSGEGFTFQKILNIKAISILSASSSTVRLIYW
jgi:hypothetical protein